MLKLGMKVVDCVTGFAGVVVERCEFLTGSSRYLVQPRAADNIIPSSVYFDEERLVAETVQELVDLKCEIEA